MNNELSLPYLSSRTLIAALFCRALIICRALKCRKFHFDGYFNSNVFI
jgi:hypothetical protein